MTSLELSQECYYQHHLILHNKWKEKKDDFSITENTAW